MQFTYNFKLLKIHICLFLSYTELSTKITVESQIMHQHSEIIHLTTLILSHVINSESPKLASCTCPIV